MEFSEEEFMTLATFLVCNDLQENIEDIIDVEVLNGVLNKIAENQSNFSHWVDLYLHIKSNG